VRGDQESNRTTNRVADEHDAGELLIIEICPQLSDRLVQR
jgi:hypothetical protein